MGGTLRCLSLYSDMYCCSVISTLREWDFRASKLLDTDLFWNREPIEQPLLTNPINSVGLRERGTEFGPPGSHVVGETDGKAD